MWAGVRAVICTVMTNEHGDGSGFADVRGLGTDSGWDVVYSHALDRTEGSGSSWMSVGVYVAGRLRRWRRWDVKHTDVVICAAGACAASVCRFRPFRISSLRFSL